MNAAAAPHEGFYAMLSDILGRHQEIAPENLELEIIETSAPQHLDATLPLGVVLLTPAAMLIPVIVATALCSLAFPGGVAAKTGGAKVSDGVLRVTTW